MTYQNFLETMIDKIVISEQEIDQINQRLAFEITQQYKGKHPLFIGIMKGCFPFISDLTKYIPLDISYEYIKISVYGDNLLPDEAQFDIKTLNHFLIEGRDVILVDEILDRGITLKLAYDWVQSHRPKSIKTCVMIDRVMDRPHFQKADFTGYALHSHQWVVGYGCDYQQLFRNLPYLALMKI